MRSFGIWTYASRGTSSYRLQVLFVLSSQAVTCITNWLSDSDIDGIQGSLAYDDEMLFNPRDA